MEEEQGDVMIPECKKGEVFEISLNKCISFQKALENITTDAFRLRNKMVSDLEGK